MRRTLLAAILFLLPLPVFAAETISDFSVNASVDSSRNLTVQETISYDFGDTERHGIYRIIPVTYSRNGGTYQLRISVDGVRRDGAEEPYTAKTSGGELTIKIGNAEKTISGRHVYEIRYHTDRAINFFKDGHSELYWNVTGNGWEVPIERSSFTVLAPDATNISSVTSACFTGEVGSTENGCLVSPTASGFIVKASRVLLGGEGLTVVFGFPDGTIRKPTVFELVRDFFLDNGILFFPLAAIVVMLFLWRKNGKDPARRTVVPEYEAPRKLAAALIAGSMTENGTPNQAVTATIIDLARRDYLHIRFTEEKKLFGTQISYTFVKKNPADDTLAPFERTILSGLFKGGDERTIDNLKTDKFYVSVAAFKKEVGSRVDEMKIFAANPAMVRGSYIAVAFIVGWGLSFFFQANIVETLASITTGLVIAVFGWYMPRRTEDGVKLLAEIDGFKWFLSVTEKDRLAFTDAPERTPEQFQAFLPYAIVFGVEKNWADQFKSLNMPPPGWAEGNVSNMNAYILASHISDMNRSATAAAFSPPSQAGSGGSGFSGGGSGGGFGGGGGGSW